MVIQPDNTGSKMRTSSKCLVRRDGKSGHDETVVHVEWDGLTDEDIKVLASFYIINCVEQQLKTNTTRLPEQVVVNGRDYLHREVIVEKKVKVPDSWKSGEDKPARGKAVKERQPTLLELLKALTPEERKTLLS